MTDVLTICSEVGRAKLGVALGVSKAAVSNASSSGQFPAKWYLVVKGLCEEKGILCPIELFSFDKKLDENERAA